MRKIICFVLLLFAMSTAVLAAEISPTAEQLEELIDDVIASEDFKGETPYYPLIIKHVYKCEVSNGVLADDLSNMLTDGGWYVTVYSDLPNGQDQPYIAMRIVYENGLYVCKEYFYADEIFREMENQAKVDGSTLQNDVVILTGYNSVFFYALSPDGERILYPAGQNAIKYVGREWEKDAKAPISYDRLRYALQASLCYEIYLDEQQIGIGSGGSTANGGLSAIPDEILTSFDLKSPVDYKLPETLNPNDPPESSEPGNSPVEPGIVIDDPDGESRGDESVWYIMIGGILLLGLLIISLKNAEKI